jgi:hypothetical protein
METKQWDVHTTDGGAVYVVDNHRFADASVMIRIDGSVKGDPGAAAEMIVRAVNSHAELLAAAEAFAADFDAYINSDDYDLPDPSALRAAIAKAKGGA